MEFLSEEAQVEGWRDERESITLPDVRLTGDEFLHMLAIQGEVLPGNPTAHTASRVPLGFPSPDCSNCRAIMGKSDRFRQECERRGAG